MSATDELLPIPPQPEISEGNKVFHEKAYALYKWMRTKLGPAIIEVSNLMRNAVTGAFTATSTTSMEITEGEKTLTISAGRSFMPGTPVRVARTSAPENYLDGITKTYDVVTGTFVFDGVTPNGSGTFTDWSISIIPSSGGGLASLFTNKFSGLQSFANEVTVASATNIDLTAAGSNQFKLTGSEVVETITMPQGAPITGRVAGTPTLKNSATLIVQGGVDYVCEVKDKLSVIKDADGNVHVTIQKANGKPVINDVENAATDSTFSSTSSTKAATPEWVKQLFKLSTSVSTNGAAAYDFSIPAGVKRVSILFNSVSTNGSSEVIVQLASGGSVEVTGYLTASSAVSNAVATANSTQGFVNFTNGQASSSTRQGSLVINLLSANIWTLEGAIADTSSARIYPMAGVKSLSGVLDRVRITTVGGTDLFDAGSINVSWEF